jgi:DNA-binding LytR/AlgR family response regulator
MNVVIIEDEYLLAEELEDKLLAINPEIKIVAKLESVKDSIDWFKANTCDLIFLDVHLSDGISFSIFDEISISTPIIFTTAYNHYAIKAFEVNSISYILKPINDKDLERALDKYTQLQNTSLPDFSALNELLLAKPLVYKKRLVLNIGKIHKPVLVEDIAYFMADDKYLFAIVNTGEKFFCDFTLAKLETEINPNDFFRVNRRYFVSFASVKELIPYSKSRIKIKIYPETEEEVIISTSRAKEFKEWLEN